MTMTKDKVVSELRREAVIVRNAMVAVLFIGFGSMAIAATVLDILAISE